LCLSVLLAGCSSTTPSDEATAPEPPAGSPSGVQNLEPAPDSPEPPPDLGWLYQEFYERFPLKFKEEIRTRLHVLQVDLDNDLECEILAWMVLDAINGYAVLYDRDGEEYRAVFEYDRPLHQVAFGDYPNALFISTMGQHGTGLQVNWFSLWAGADGSVREVWTGVERTNMHGRSPYVSRYCGVSLAGLGSCEERDLLHTTRSRMEDENGEILAHQERVDMYAFDSELGRFVPQRAVPGVGRHIILAQDMVLAGTGIFYRLVALDALSTDSLALQLADSSGQVLWREEMTANGEESERSMTGWFFSPADAPTGDYTIQLVSVETGEVLDSATLYIHRAEDCST